MLGTTTSTTKTTTITTWNTFVADELLYYYTCIKCNQHFTKSAKIQRNGSPAFDFVFQSVLPIFPVLKRQRQETNWLCWDITNLSFREFCIELLECSIHPFLLRSLPLDHHREELHVRFNWPGDCLHLGVRGLLPLKQSFLLQNTVRIVLFLTKNPHVIKMLYVDALVMSWQYIFNRRFNHIKILKQRKLYFHKFMLSNFVLMNHTIGWAAPTVDCKI